MAWTLAARSATVNPSGAAASAATAARAVRVRALLRSMPPTRVLPIIDGWGSWSKMPSGTKATSTQSRVVQKRSSMPAEAGDDVGEACRGRGRPRGLGVVADRLEAQHVLAFGVALQRQGPEVDLEDGEAVLRCLDHGCHSG